MSGKLLDAAIGLGIAHLPESERVSAGIMSDHFPGE
jgi:hypothetical protein